MKFLISFFIIFIYSTSYNKSNDSPNLKYKSENTISWNQWLKELKKELADQNFKPSTLDNLDRLVFNKKVIELDRKQPEFKLNFNQYLKRYLTPKKKEKLKKKYLENKELLENLEKKFNVDSKVLVSLWFVETSFGEYLGKFDILNSLASLAYDGRRRDFFLKELKYALRILDEGHFSRQQFKGSWAGAFGQTQFMPSTFKKFATDFDDNKKINLFNKVDALASGANYLNKVGWNNKIMWGEKINLKITKDLKRISTKKLYKETNYWEKYGIIFKNKYNKKQLMRLVIPDSLDNQYFLVTKNFDVILDWNRSNYFALTILLLSNEIN
ncbi:MAG: lytic transglycosylase [Alphaproteobacteria bacterium]|nr:lytic transglycosylase [Alphaproteobacteria bacterium]